MGEQIVFSRAYYTWEMITLLHNLALIGFSFCFLAVTNHSYHCRKEDAKVSQDKTLTLGKKQKINILTV